MVKKHPSIKEILEGIFRASKDSRNIQKRSLEFAKKETNNRRKFQWISIGVAIPTFIVALLSLNGIMQLNLNTLGLKPLDYAINTTVSPSEIILNSDSDISFTFNFTNVGSKNITGFQVLEINFYRDIDKKEYQIYSSQFDSGRHYLYCSDFESNNVIMPGESCALKDVKLYSCPECFDDKEKAIHLFVYFKSIPPIQNSVVNLTII